MLVEKDKKTTKIQTIISLSNTDCQQASNITSNFEKKFSFYKLARFYDSWGGKKITDVWGIHRLVLSIVPDAFSPQQHCQETVCWCPEMLGQRQQVNLWY